MCLLSNQIAGFFDPQCFWNLSSDILIFLHEDDHQVKITSETTAFGWMWLGVLHVQSDCRIP